jgi:hypothetical protein
MPQRVDPDLLLDFPCHYEFKAFGEAGVLFADAVKSAVSQVVPVAADAVRTRHSSGGRYQSVTVCVKLHNSDQLKQIYAELQQADGLKYLL